MSAAGHETEQAFEKIYREGTWCKSVRSGEGSVPERNREYISLLQRFIRERGARGVVDLGCGDWSFSRLIDWSGVDYTGVDIVPELVQSHNAQYAREGVRFIQGNFITCELPPADLAISKDVLQHLPNEMIFRFLDRLRNFKYAILTNDRTKYEPRTWRRLWRAVESPQVANSDIPGGEWRPLRLREAPFNLDATELMRIRMWHSNGVHVKEVLLWQNK
jgi:trans-aconitate methyltransferase